VTTALHFAGEEALRALCADHGEALLGFALRLTAGDRGRAEDIVQETLIRAWRHPAALDPSRGAIRPWLFTVARRIAIDAHRSRRARPAEVDLDRATQLAVPDDIDGSLQSWIVEDALRGLSRDHRAVLVETFYRGHSVGEAAAVLGIPVGTVKSRSYYALRALRLALQERGMTP
jgi:RNA polymerase sigma-70 factor (ECF subfamily)